jgi:hypothetical protein
MMAGWTIATLPANTDRLVDKQPYIRHARELARLIE